MNSILAPSICFILLLIAFIINIITREKIVVYYALFPALISIVFLLLFNEYGPDINAYKTMFLEVKAVGVLKHHTDVGFAFIMYMMHIIEVDFYFFLAFINTVSLLFIFIVFDKYSPFVTLSWLMYFVLFIGYQHTVLRQGVALSITFFSFNYILKNNLRMFVLLMLFSSAIHSSAIIFFPAYWIANLNWNSKKIYILLLLVFPFVLVDMVTIIAKVAGLLGLNEGVIRLYFSKEGELYEKAGLSLGLIVRILFYLLFSLSFDEKDKVQKAIFNLYSFYLMLYFPLSSISMLSSRGLDYYKVYECIMLPFALINAKHIYYKIAILLITLVYYIYAFPKQYTFLDRNMDCLLLRIINSLQL